MQVHSKVSSMSKEAEPQELCSAIIYVYSKWIYLHNVIQIFKVPICVVRDLLRVLEQNQKLRAEYGKVMLVDPAEKAQITRLIGE